MSDKSPQGPRPEKPAVAEAVQLDAYIRRNFVHAGVMLLALVVGLAVLSASFEAELLAVTGKVHRLLGLAGLYVIVFLADGVTFPLPPDAVLLVVARTDLRQDWMAIVLTIGIISSLGGMFSWFIARWLGDKLAPAAVSRLRTRHADHIDRYGVWVVVLGALTPIPYSITCLAAGAAHMPFARFGWITLLRIPRFFIYYLGIAYSADLGRFLFVGG